MHRRHRPLFFEKKSACVAFASADDIGSTGVVPGRRVATCHGDVMAGFIDMLRFRYILKENT